jgi:hypothetical protein
MTDINVTTSMIMIFSVTENAHGICLILSSIRSGNGGKSLGSGKRSSTIVIINEQKYTVHKASRHADKVFFLSERIEPTKQQPVIG